MPIRLRSIDRQFARFCRTGDAEALGRVFDASARELLHIAAWLTGNRADAEDLLQRTFLTAIEDRASFARQRRVMPWLTGILTNHARNLRRERARCAPLPGRPEPIGDPVAEASEAEFAEWLRAAREQIGPPYAEVLALHLEHGCNAKEIAERLHRPAGTVRTQLMRALELLRKRLPGGFAAALAPMPADPRLLGTIKQSVLAAARQAAFPTATAAVATVTLATGGLLMTKKALLVIAATLLLLAFGVFVCWPNHAATRPGDSAANAALVTDRQPTKAATTPSSPGTGSVARREPASPVEADPGFGSLRVVVRWQHDGSPAAGVGVTVRQLRSYSLRRDGVTDADGTCTLHHLSPARWFASCTHANSEIAMEVAADVQGTVQLTAERQAMVRGTVLDDAGTPVEGARIWISEGRGPDERQFVVGRSDARGWFALPVHGRQLVGARKAGMIPALAVPVEAGKGDREITLRMGGLSASVRGVVRDVAGMPVAWARVELGPGEQVWGLAEATQDLVQAYGPQVITGADGRFAFDDVDHAPRLGAPVLRAWAEGFAPHFSLPALHPGTVTEVGIELESAAIVQGTVRDATGAPVAQAYIRLGRIPRDLWHSSPSTQSDATGRFVLHDLPAGNIPVSASSPAGAAATELQLISGQRTEWNPVVGNGRTIRGTVFETDGTPMAGMTICIVDPDTLSIRASTADSAGRFTLVNVGDKPVTLDVGDYSKEPLQVIENVAPDTDNLEIRLTHADQPTARIRGRLVDEHGGPVPARVGVPAHRGLTRVSDVQTDGTGAFDLGPLRPGLRQLDISTRERGVVLLDPVDVTPDQTRDLGTITVPRPGSATFAMASADGAPLARAIVWLYTTRGSDGRPVAGTEIKDGKGRIDALPPGRWWVITDKHGIGPAEIEIRSDQDTHLDLRPK